MNKRPEAETRYQMLILWNTIKNPPARTYLGQTIPLQTHA